METINKLPINPLSANIAPLTLGSHNLAIAVMPHMKEQPIIPRQLT